MKHKAIFAFVAVTYVLAGAALITTPQPAKADDEKVRLAVQKTRVGRTTGMTLEEALKVAVECVNKAAGFKAISYRREMRLNRLEDKLEFLGITDTTRLNALKRYLVRNEEIGTQSVYVSHPIDPDQLRFYRYMITSHDLLGVKKDWTLLKLAQFIADRSGISKMPESTARSILADCRAYADGGKPQDLPTPLPPPTPPPTPTPTPTPLFAQIKGTLLIGANPAEKSRKFAECVVNDETYGIPSVRFDSTKGDSLQYFLEFTSGAARQPMKSGRTPPSIAFIEAAVNSNWTFDCLAEFISDYAQVELPVNSLAGEIAMTAIDRNKAPACPNPVSTKPCEFDKDSAIGQLLSTTVDAAGRDGFDRLILDLKANLNTKPARSYCPNPVGPVVTNAKRLAAFSTSDRIVGPCNIGASVTRATTIRKLIDIVRNCLVS